ncbi:MAG: type II secretion system protein GspK [Pseudomonadota bacterium]|nr:type II secretion system protein GspK [Pseudomonadota bacterium]
MNTPINNHSQRGTVLIITLWTITLLTILVTVLAGQSRLSARATQYHQEEVQNWANVSAAINQAEMEVMLDLMDAPVLTPAEQAENPVPPRYRQYRGEPVQLSWPQAEDVVVRVWDHAGKINLTEISRPRLRALIEKKLGDDADQVVIDELMSAWNDWLDLNRQPAANGAEAEFYGELDLPYTPRNGRLESVEELLQIRGFAEVFADVDLDAAFTVYGDSDLVNLNLATVEAMRLLPGLDDELIDEIIAWRANREFIGNGDIAQLVPADRMGELRPWMNSRRTSNFFTIMAYRRQSPDNAAGFGSEAPGFLENAVFEDAVVIDDPFDAATTAYAEIVDIASFNNKPRVLKINPYQNIPIRKIVTDTEGAR